MFQGMDGGAVRGVLERAFGWYRRPQQEWSGLVGSVMTRSSEWSWENPTGQYINVYRGALKK